MPNLRGLGWLLWRVTWRRSQGIVGPAAVLAIGSALLAVLAMATFAAPNILANERLRSSQLAPRTDHRSPGSGGGLRTVEPVLIQHRLWNGHDIVRNYYARGSSTMIAPGVPRMPREREYYASPDLRALIGSDPVVASLFEGSKLQGLIAPSGLTQPHELRAIVGISEREWSLVPVVGFGPAGSDGDQPGPITSQADRNRTLNRAVMFLVLALVWAPGATFIVLLTRLSASRRRQRARALRSLGLSLGMVRLANSLEIALVVAPCAAIGAAAYRLWVHRVTFIPGTEWGYFPDDADPGLVKTVLIVASITLLAVGSSASSLRERPDAPAELVLPPASSRASSAGLQMLGVSLAYLACMKLLVRVLHDGAVIGMWIADALVAVGLALAAPRLVGKAFGLLRGRVRSGGVLVGLRLAAAGSSTSQRLGGMLAVVIVLLLGSLTFMNVLQNGGQANWSVALAANRRVPVVVNDISGTLVLKDVSNVDPGAGTVQILGVPRKGRDLSVVLGDCGDLEVLGGSPPHNCGSGPQWIAVDGVSGPSHYAVGRVQIPGVGRVFLPASTAITKVSHVLPKDLDGALLVPTRYAATKPTALGSRFMLLASNATLRLTLAKLSGMSPSAQFDLGALERLDPDAKEFPAQLKWLNIGAGLALCLGVLALWVVVMAEVQERSRRLRGLRILGAPRRQVALAHFWSTGAPVILIGWAGVGGGCLACLAMYAFDDRGRVEYGVAGWISVLVLVVGIVLSVATFRDALRVSSQSASLDA